MDQAVTFLSRIRVASGSMSSRELDQLVTSWFALAPPGECHDEEVVNPRKLEYVAHVL
jgi:hypothetical protein